MLILRKLMNKTSFYDLDHTLKEIIFDLKIAKGDKVKITNITSGMCGDIYIFEREKHIFPQYICAKIPKKIPSLTNENVNDIFINELRKQLNYSGHKFVHWAYDFEDLMGIPVALFRYWGGDLRNIINSKQENSLVQKLSIMAYICSGLEHCYSKGLISHQDLKPENIFINDLKSSFQNLPNLDIYKCPLIADFGLANAFKESNIFDGARPYMAPEQWNKETLSVKTDIFSLGIIFFELMSNGIHPVGIKLTDHWPQPKKESTKKWTRADSWRKWACKTKNLPSISEIPIINSDFLSLYSQMISLSQNDRPTLEYVLKSILDMLNKIDSDAFCQVSFLINYFNEQASSDPIEIRWPSLSEKWLSFEKRFSK